MSERLDKSAGSIGEFQYYHITTVLASQQVNTSTHGCFFNGFYVGNPGTGVTITLANGPVSTATNIFSVITPVANMAYDFALVLDRGLYVTVTGTPGDFTLTFMDEAI